MAVVNKIATFLGKEIDDTQLEKIVAHCSFNEMRTNPATNYSWWDAREFANKNRTDFFRRGVHFHLKSFSEHEYANVLADIIPDDFKGRLKRYNKCISYESIHIL